MSSVASIALWTLAAFVRADDAAASLYVRTDTDHTTVISPHTRVGLQLAEGTDLDITYAADVWTSASIDIRTSASVRPVTEQRDELDVGITHELSDVKLDASYRFSTEHDYTSHGLNLGVSYEFADNAATFAGTLHIIGDTVGESGDPSFARGLSTIDGRVSLTQVIDTETIASLTYELARNGGYQSSPYRYVGFGGTGFGCQGATLCLHEHTPDTRLRHAIALLIRRAIGEDVSLGLTYRYYFDDWGLGSHTVLPELGWNIGPSTTLALRYRFYTQGAVSFYRAVYMGAPLPGTFTTRDRELSPLSIQRFGAELTHTLELDEGRHSLALTFGLGGNSYTYDDFVGLTSTQALEVTTAMVLTL